MDQETGEDIERLRRTADQIDCLIEEDFQQLAKATLLTVEAWRKRGIGPAYILLGKRYLYPRKAIADYVQSLIRERTALPAAGQL